MTEELDHSHILKDNDFIWYKGEKYKKVEEPKTLKELFEIYVKYGDFARSKDVIAQELVNIVKEFIPKPLEYDCHPYMTGHNVAIRKMEENLK